MATSASLRAAGLLALLAPLLAVPACGSNSGSLARIGVATPHQEAVGSPSVALHYREVGAIQVLRLDASGQPEPGIAVSFAITGDSAGFEIHRGLIFDGG